MEVPRDALLSALRRFCFDGSGVVVGAPGIGKTVALKRLHAFLESQRIPLLYLPIDKLAVQTQHDLVAELGLTGDLLDHLRAVVADRGDQCGVLIVDAFDAARSEEKRQFFLSLIRRVLNQMGDTWHVLASVRTFDARKSEDLTDLFPPSTLNAAPEPFHSAAFVCRHFVIPPFTDEEVRSVAESVPGLLGVYEGATPEFRELLHVPFNLWLLRKLLDRTPNLPELTSVTSEVELLSLFWKQRVTDGPLGEARRAVLSDVCHAMVQARGLSVRKDRAYDPVTDDAWRDLLSAEVLEEVGTSQQRVSFSHNILFDYAVSVLLIEDEPERVVEFVGEDPSRPLFLRPSLDYYFTRQWHESPATFWRGFWYLLAQEDINIRLVGRLLPPTVAVRESRQVDDLSPLLDALRQGWPGGAKGVLRVLQALRALDVKRDALWCRFLESITPHVEPDWAWDLAVIASEILDRAESAGNDQTIGACGNVGRLLLGWVWRQREHGSGESLDRLGAFWAVPLVARTFCSDTQESRRILEPILSLPEQPDFPINYLYRMVHHLDSIWPFDPEFAAAVYETVFAHEEESQEPTPMGGYVLPMSSNRRQDYEMCKYMLVEHFPAFVRAAPAPATKACIRSLNEYVIRRHVQPYLRPGVSLEDLPERFPFRGGEAVYFPDLSYIWDESEHPDEPVKLADHLFIYVAEVASRSDGLATLGQLLDIFRDEVRAAVFWRRLLRIGARNPFVFASLVSELCVARPVLRGPECRYELGLFLEAAASEFSNELLGAIETMILALPPSEESLEARQYASQLQDRLLARLPQDRLQTEEARARRREMQKTRSAPPNEPPVSTRFTWEPFSEEDWFAEQGVDVTREPNQRLMAFFGKLDSFIDSWLNEQPDPGALDAILPVISDAHEACTAENDADLPISTAAWTKTAQCAEIVARARMRDSPDSPDFFLCREILLRCANHGSPEPDPERDAHYDLPSWSPAPRNEAAQGLFWLVVRRADKELLAAIEKLANDPVPSVRFLSTRNLWCLRPCATELMWRVVDHLARNEANHTILHALCRTLGRLAAGNEEAVVKTLRVLADRALAGPGDSAFVEAFLGLLLWLVFVRDNGWAKRAVAELLRQPTERADVLSRAAFEALTYVTPRKMLDSSSSTAAERAVAWLREAIGAAVGGIAEIRRIPESEWSDLNRAQLKGTYSVLDHVVMRLFFSSGLGPTQRADTERVSDKERRAFYFAVKPLLEQILSFTLDEQSGVLFAPTAHHFMELLNGVLRYDPRGVLHMAAGVAKSSSRYGYNLDSLAIRETVKLTEAVLADYRHEVREGEPLRDLLTLLDVFAEAGWPDALRLIWRLDEVYR